MAHRLSSRGGLLVLLWLLGVSLTPCVGAPTPANPGLVAASIFPYVTEDDQGFLFRVFQEMAHRAGSDQPIQYLPLARALEEARTKPLLLIPLGRSVEREAFLTFGPVLYNDALVFVTRAGEKGLVKSLEQARGLAVATHLGSTTETFLHNNGYTDVRTAPDNSNLLKMLLLKRADAIVLANGILMATANGRDFQRSDFEVALPISKYPLYLAASKTVDPGILARYEKILEEMKADGTYAALTAGF